LKALITTTWSWVGFADPVKEYRVENRGNYTLTFKDGSAVEIVADCNKALDSARKRPKSTVIEIPLFRNTQIDASTSTDLKKSFVMAS
jgi:hypothetical protein